MHLERLIKEALEKGCKPYFVNCTCGTTVLGAFDPILPIADICEKYNLWLHVDVSEVQSMNKYSKNFDVLKINYLSFAQFFEEINMKTMPYSVL